MSETRNLDDYRPCVGVIVFNKSGKVFLGHRMGATGQYVWQFPQGGMDEGETAMGAALRELFEETGIRSGSVSLLAKIDDWLFYDFPADFKASKKARGKRGQRQRWFAFLFTGDENEIDLEAVPPTEFSEWRWGELEETTDTVVPFKREVYERLAIEFAGFAKPQE